MFYNIAFFFATLTSGCIFVGTNKCKINTYSNYKINSNT